ncbi:MAG: hypothetical protein ACYDDB_03525 [bacterium]
MMKKYPEAFLFSSKAKRKACKRKKNFSDRESSLRKLRDDWNYKKISQAFLTENFTPVASSGYKIFLNAYRSNRQVNRQDFKFLYSETKHFLRYEPTVDKPIDYSLKFFSPMTKMKPREFHFNIEKRLSKTVKFLCQSPSPKDVNLHNILAELLRKKGNIVRRLFKTLKAHARTPGKYGLFKGA